MIVITSVVGLLAALLAAGYWFLTQEPPGAPAEPHEMRPRERSPHAGGPAVTSAPAAEDNTVTIAPERLQTIGVRFQEAARRPLEKVIRTVGRVDVD
ncbi:MAG TPA: hypothetical protein VFA78_01115, partial [Chloroflexota bacterium]|nr:hypothetical protein [Chloroflexota bacterium]